MDKPNPWPFNSNAVGFLTGCAMIGISGGVVQIAGLGIAPVGFKAEAVA